MRTEKLIGGAKRIFDTGTKVRTLSLILFFILISSVNSIAANTQTVASGNWSNGSNWSNGVPSGGTNATVNNSMTLDANLSTTGTYTINAPVTDASGGTNYSLTVGSSGNVDIHANTTIEGVFNLSGSLFGGNANMTIRSGDTLVVGYPGSTATSSMNSFANLTIEAGGVLIIYGNLDIAANANIYCDGQILIDGNFVGETGYFFIEFPSSISGSGSITTTGSATTDGSSTIFGSTTDCNTGPCSGGGLCGITNTISSAQSICAGSTPSTITGNSISSVTYQWQKSTTSAIQGFTNISGATSKNLSFSSGVSVNTWYRRIATTTGGCSNPSQAVEVSMSNLTASVSVSASSTSICTGTSVTFTATPTNGGSSPTYQWKLNGSNVGSNSSTYSTSALANGDIVTCVMTSSASCVTGSPATSNSITMTVTSPVAASVSISSSVTTICSSTSVTFTATPTNGGSSPSYQWKKNGSNVGSNSATYSTSGLADGDVVSCVMTSNATCVAGSPATSNSITVTVVSGSGSWVGVTSNNWKTTSNWCSNSKPTSTTNVVINGGVTNDPLVSSASGAAVCKNMTINNGGLLKVAGSTLTISGNLSITSGGSLVITGGTVNITGKLTVNSGGSVTIISPGALNVQGNITNSDSIIGTGTLTLNGTSSQVISGSSGIFENVTLNNSSGCQFSSPQTITGILTLTSGTLTSTGNLTLDLNTGSISGSGSGSFSGNLNVKKSISATGYHYLAAPLAGITPSQFADDVYLNVMYSYNESLVTSDSMQGWIGVTNFGSSMTQMTGYALDLESTGNINLTGTYNHSGSYSSTLTHTNNNAGNLNTGGWNLVGNPYPSTIDWGAASGWTKTGIDNSIYYWNPVSQTYASYVSGLGTNGGTQYIPSMQGFYVHVSSVGTGTFGMNKNVRTTSVNPSLWKESALSNILRLKASHTGHQDETVIRLSEDATDSFDGELDAYKMYNESAAPDLYTTVNGVDYSINSLPDSVEESIIPLNLMGSENGDYTISATGLESFNGGYEIYLIDSVANIVQDLMLNSEYKLSYNSDVKRKLYVSFKKASLPIQNSTTGIFNSVSSNAKIGSDGTNLIVQFENAKAYVATLIVFDVFGHEVYRINDVSTSQSFSTRVPVSSGGIYMVKLEMDGSMFNGKVFLK